MQKRVQEKGGKCTEMMLTNCTWEKFGDIMAQAGGRQLGLFDELTSFFASMNMYSSQKGQVSNTKEYTDLLQIFTGKNRTRETGNKYSFIFFNFITLF